MSNTAIKIENLSKRYRLGLVGSGTLKDDLKGWWYRARGKEDPTMKIGEENRLDTRSGKYVWALKDIDLEVKQGEVLGIIGKNGAGKSTLLKILSQVTGPTTGAIKTRGRIASLLEVGTGMHPELTGRENIFLNGAILGMTKAEIRAKFEEIVDFAGVARYIDTPVKRYSSGMRVRLGFAVAAFLEPEILIVDEVLAVGDAEFQKKAIGKMQDVSKGEGRTVLFVSHNMASVKKLCTRGVLIGNGRIKKTGTTEEVVDEYLEVIRVNQGMARNKEINPSKKLQITSVALRNEEMAICSEFERGENISIEVEFDILVDGTAYNPAIELWRSSGECIFGSKYFDTEPGNLKTQKWKKGKYSYVIPIPSEIIKEGSYYVSAVATIPTIEILDKFPFEVGFYVKDLSSPIYEMAEGRNGIIMPILQWNQNR